MFVNSQLEVKQNFCFTDEEIGQLGSITWPDLC